MTVGMFGRRGGLERSNCGHRSDTLHPLNYRCCGPSETDSVTQP